MHEREDFITIDDGARLFFHQLGDGPLPVIIPNVLFMLDDFRRLASDDRTLLFLDWRNRGRSKAPPSTRGVLQDVDDLESVRRAFGFERIAVIAHSYSATTALLYAMQHPVHTDRVVQLGPMPPFFGKDYDEKCVDETFMRVMTGMQALEQERASTEPIEFCRKVWALLKVLYVVDPADASKLAWDPCALENERNFRKEFIGNVMPSLQKLDLTADDIARVETPVLIIHGRRDRSAAYGGGAEWARLLPNARLVTVDDGGHFPWIEAPEVVFGAIEAFLSWQ